MQARRGWTTTATVAVVLAALAFLAPLAQAAAPANDNFANREVLNGALPIEASRSNAGAGKEGGESMGPFAAGHSVWFQWTAPATAFFTVGACTASFHTVVGIFTGSELGLLTGVAQGNSAEGPDCPVSESQYTFKATAGTEYAIAVDGFGFIPMGPPPDTEGNFTLMIEETPVPANDDFANAANVGGQISEEPDGIRFYFASIRGYNWNAGKELGEQNHAEDPGGASVWYRWTAPESGTARISTCCGSTDLLALYSGQSLGALTPIASTGSFPSGIATSVIAGTEYHLAVDGPEDGSSGEAAMGSFSLHVSMALASGPGEAKGGSGSPQQPKDVTPPETTILKRTIKPGKRQATFNFTSSEAGGGFRCKLDARALAACNPPKTYSGLAPGKHVFRVAAVDSAGNTDASSAVARFAIPKPKARHRSSR